MKRIATDDGLFHDGNPWTGELGTPVVASWLNGVQEELLAVVEDAGLVPSGLNNAQMLEALRALAPAGQVAHFARTSPPAGWLKCNGAAVSRTTYARLFAAIGTTFGAGDGSTTFNLPDARGEFLRGLDDGRGVDAGRALGSAQAGGNAAHTHAGSSEAAGGHSHGGSTGSVAGHNHGGWTGGGGEHAHTYDTAPPATSPDAQGAADGASWLDLTQYSARWTSTVGNHQHSIATDGGHAHVISSDGNHSHAVTIGSSGAEARPRNLALLVCIKH